MYTTANAQSQLNMHMKQHKALEKTVIDKMFWRIISSSLPLLFFYLIITCSAHDESWWIEFTSYSYIDIVPWYLSMLNNIKGFKNTQADVTRQKSSKWIQYKCINISFIPNYLCTTDLKEKKKEEHIKKNYTNFPSIKLQLVSFHLFPLFPLLKNFTIKCERSAMRKPCANWWRKLEKIGKGIQQSYCAYSMLPIDIYTKC